MNTAQPLEFPARLRGVAVLALMLQRLESNDAPIGADQYRSVALRLAEEFDRVPADGALDALLNLFPAAAEAYENHRYAHAGLCRSPLDRSMDSEQLARAVIGRAAAGTA